MTTPGDIDRGFYEQAVNALARQGVSGLDLLKQYPKQSKKQLAEIVGNGATARGLTMALFEEARLRSSIRGLAKELVYREILQEFPDGWDDKDSVRPTVKIGSWHYDVGKFAPECEPMATAILRALATTDKPNVGWKPTSPDDEQLRYLFEAFWPNDA